MADLLEFVLTAVFWIVRALLWLAWELWFTIIGWGIGWCVCRAFSLGRFPVVGIGEEDKCDLLTRLSVEILGLIAFGGLAWLLAEVLWG